MNPEPDQKHSTFRIPYSAFLRSPVLWLGLGLLAPLLPVLLHPAGRVIGYSLSDNPSMFYYYNDFAGRCWREGTVPLWNPHVMMGIPFLGEGQAAVFHPLSWLFVALPTGIALNWINALSFLMGGLFFYGWLRTLELERSAAACGALAWSFSNVFIARIFAGHLTNVMIFFELPLMLMLWERWRATRRLANMVGLALAYAAMILAAHPQFLSIFSMFFLIYVLLQAVPEMRTPAGRAREARSIGLLAAFIVLAIGIGVIQLWPMADFAEQSFRTQVNYNYSTMFSFNPENLVSLLAPNFFGGAYAIDRYWGRDLPWEMWIHIGALPLMLALVGVAAAPRARRVALLVCAIVFLIFALGRYTPLFPLIYKIIPFFRIFRGPSKNIIITQLCLAAFAAYGAQRLLHPPGGGPDRRGLRLGLIAGGVMLLTVVLLYVVYIPGYEKAGSNLHRLIGFLRHNRGGDNLTAESVQGIATRTGHELLRAAGAFAVGLGVLGLAWSGKWRRALAPLTIVVIAADLLIVFGPMLRSTYDVSITRMPAEVIAPISNDPYPARLLQTELGPESTNRAMHHGYSTVSGYTGNALLRYSNYVNRVKQLPAGTSQVADPINLYSSRTSFFAYDWLIVKKEQLMPGWEPVANAEGLWLVRAPDPFPRAFLAAAPLGMSTEQALEYVNEPLDWLSQPAIEGVDPPAEPAAVGPGEGVLIAAYAPNRVELKVKAARERVLVLCEAYEKNWTATVNEAEARIFPANYLFRGVVVPKGESRVVFEYRPLYFRGGLAISLLSLAGVIGLGLGLRKRVAVWAAEECGMRNAECGMMDNNVESGMKKSTPPQKRPGKRK